MYIINRAIVQNQSSETNKSQALKVNYGMDFMARSDDLLKSKIDFYFGLRVLTTFQALPNEYCGEMVGN